MTDKYIDAYKEAIGCWLLKLNYTGDTRKKEFHDIDSKCASAVDFLWNTPKDLPNIHELNDWYYDEDITDYDAFIERIFGDEEKLSGVKPQPREINFINFHRLPQFDETDKRYIEYVSQRTGVVFKKSFNSQSYYGEKDGRIIRISDHLNNKSNQERYFFSQDADYVSAKINGENPFAHLKSGDSVIHSAIGVVKFISYNQEKEYLVVEYTDGTEHKIDEVKFSCNSENFATALDGTKKADNETNGFDLEILISKTSLSRSSDLPTAMQFSGILSKATRAFRNVSTTATSLRGIGANVDNTKQIIKLFEKKIAKWDKQPIDECCAFMLYVLSKIPPKEISRFGSYYVVDECGGAYRLRISTHNARSINFSSKKENYKIGLTFKSINDKNTFGSNKDIFYKEHVYYTETLTSDTLKSILFAAN